MPPGLVPAAPQFGAEAGAYAGARRGGGAQPAEGEGGAGEQRGGEQGGPAGPEGQHHRARGGGPRDLSEPARHPEAGVDLQPVPRRDDGGDEGARRGGAEGDADAGDRGQRSERADPHRAGQQQDSGRSLCGRAHQVGGERDPPGGEPVGGDPRDGEQEQHRQQLAREHDAEVPGRTGADDGQGEGGGDEGGGERGEGAAGEQPPDRRGHGSESISPANHSSTKYRCPGAILPAWTQRTQRTQSTATSPAGAARCPSTCPPRRSSPGSSCWPST